MSIENCVFSIRESINGHVVFFINNWFIPYELNRFHLVYPACQFLSACHSRELSYFLIFPVNKGLVTISGRLNVIDG